MGNFKNMDMEVTAAVESTATELAAYITTQETGCCGVYNEAGLAGLIVSFLEAGSDDAWSQDYISEAIHRRHECNQLIDQRGRQVAGAELASDKQAEDKSEPTFSDYPNGLICVGKSNASNITRYDGLEDLLLDVSEDELGAYSENFHIYGVGAEFTPRLNVDWGVVL